MRRPTIERRLLATVIGLLLLCGCSAVWSVAPIGEKPAEIEAGEWEGHWQEPDGRVVALKVVDARRGALLMASCGADDEGQTSSNTMRIELRQSHDWLFANTKAADQNEPTENYAWVRVKNEEGRITFWAPDADKFRPLVEKGTLPGRREGNDVVLGRLTERQLDAIRSGKHGVLFLWDEPQTLVRIGR
jgi:hypothetical protein